MTPVSVEITYLITILLFIRPTKMYCQISDIIRELLCAVVCVWTAASSQTVCVTLTGVTNLLIHRT